MKLGFVSAILPELSLEEVLRFAQREGFACAEIMCWPEGKAERKFAGVTHLAVAGFTQSQAEDHGIRIGIENCPMLLTRDEWPGGKNLATSPVIWRRMFADIPSKNFGFNYDPSHFVL
jgi:sugar phosphate isomerase/epimerase